jgi:hypothetical protein
MSPLIPSQQLVAAIQTLLGNVSLPGLSATSKHYDLFEAFLFGLVVDAARQVTTANDVWFERPSAPGTKTHVIQLRTSPGWMHSGPQFTHAVVQLTAQRLVEVHLGIYVAGRSKIPHEYDVAIVEQTEAERARLLGVPPRSAKVVLFIEAKHWSANLGLPIAREFLGLCSDSGADIGLPRYEFSRPHGRNPAREAETRRRVPRQRHDIELAEPRRALPSRPDGTPAPRGRLTSRGTCAPCVGRWDPPRGESVGSRPLAAAPGRNLAHRLAATAS